MTRRNVGVQLSDRPLLAVAQGGSIDNRAAINALVAQANASGGNSIQLGGGTHRLTGPLLPLLTGRLTCDPNAKIVLASGYTGGLRVTVTDGVLNGTTVVTSATAAFVAGDVGRYILGNGIPIGATILSRDSATQVTISQAATTSATGVTLDVGSSVVMLVGKNAGVRNLQIQGGTASVTDSSLNPSVGAAVALGFGASYANVDGLDCTAVNGHMFLAETWRSSGLYGGIYNGIRGNYNAKGIRIAGDANNRDAQVFLDDLDPQVVQNGHVLDLDGVNDVQVGKINGCVSGAVPNTYGLRIAGNGSTIQVDSFDVGSYPSVPGVTPIIMIGDGGTPNNVRIKGPVAQSGAAAVLITGGFNVALQQMQISRATGAGVRITGGDLISLLDMTFARNGYTAAADNVEVEVTSSTARVRIARSDFTTPVGTGSQQVANVFRLPTTNRVQIDRDCRFTGGHLLEQLYAGGVKGQRDIADATVIPDDYGMLLWTDNPRLATGNSTLPTSGRICGTRIYVPYACTVSTLYVSLAVVGVGLTASYATIHNAAGQLMGQSADQSANWMAGTAPAGVGGKAIPLTAPVVLQPGWYDLGLMSTWTTTPPSFVRSANSALVSINQPASSSQGWKGDSGLTAPPATLTKSATDGFAWWFGLA